MTGVLFLKKSVIISTLDKRIKINNRITAPQLRVITDKGINLGILTLTEALTKAQETGLDLIEISPTANPPVAKIMDFGKYRYLEEKKSREAQKTHQSEVRGIRVGIDTSLHDLEMKAKKAAEFLEEGDKVRIEIVLRGRAKYLDKNFIFGRMNRVLDFIAIPHKVVETPKRGPRGYYLVVEKSK